MPRSGGTYTLPAGYLATTGQTILASQHNPPLEDIANALTDSLPRDGSAGMTADLPMGGKKITNLSSGSSSTDAATKGQVDSAIPIGVILDYGGSVAPANWLLCYGQAVSRSTYAALYAAIGTSFGAGDGSTTFNIPDYRGRVSAGKDNMGGTAASRLTTAGSGVNGATLGASGGEQSHTLSTTEIPAHNHTFSATTASGGLHHHSVYSGDAVSGGVRGLGASDCTGLGGGDNLGTGAYREKTLNGAGVLAIQDAGTHTHTVSGTADSTGGGGAHNNVQPTIVMNKIIRAL